jgi:hypothetical protein
MTNPFVAKHIEFLVEQAELIQFAADCSRQTAITYREMQYLAGVDDSGKYKNMADQSTRLHCDFSKKADELRRCAETYRMMENQNEL